MDYTKSVEIDEIPEKSNKNQNSTKVQSNLIRPEQSSEVVKNEINIPEYFIIGGSFEILSNAENLVIELKNKGFDAKIVGQNKYGLHRVSYSGFSERSEASKQLKVINPRVVVLYHGGVNQNQQSICLCYLLFCPLFFLLAGILYFSGNRSYFLILRNYNNGFFVVDLL